MNDNLGYMGEGSWNALRKRKVFSFFLNAVVLLWSECQCTGDFQLHCLTKEYCPKLEVNTQHRMVNGTLLHFSTHRTESKCYFAGKWDRPTVIIRDLRSFKIRFEFESNDPIQFDSIRKWRADSDLKFRIGRTCRTNHAHCSTKNFNRCSRCN